MRGSDQKKRDVEVMVSKGAEIILRAREEGVDFLVGNAIMQFDQNPKRAIKDKRVAKLLLAFMQIGHMVCELEADRREM